MSSPIAAPEERGPKLVKATPIGLKDAGVTEAWLENEIQKDPSILGLGDLEVKDRQRGQEKAGRLDLLLEDDSGEKRYELELMLGPTDESHLIRTVEYWDVERRMWPGYEHCAVLVAESVTARFLNVISLFSGTVPFVAIQVNGLTVDGNLVLNFVKVLDSRRLRKDEAGEIMQKVVTRQDWVDKASATTVELAEKCIAIINQAASVTRKAGYLRHYIGLNDGVRASNFVTFRPKKEFLNVQFEALSPTEPWLKRLLDSGLAADVKNDFLRVTLTPKGFEDNKGLLTELLQEAVREYEKG